MRRKAVFVSGFMALLLGMFILSGCAAEAKNTSEVFAKMQEASQSLNGFAMEMQMNANMDQAGNQVQFITSIDGEMLMKPELAFDLKVKLDMLGQEMDTQLVLAKDGFFTKGPDGNWTQVPKEQADLMIGKALSSQYDPNQQIEELEQFVDDFSMTQTKDAYILKISAVGEKFEQFMQEQVKKQLGAQNELLDMIGGFLEDYTIHKAEYTLVIDKKTYYLKGLDLMLDFDFKLLGQEVKVKSDTKSNYSKFNEITEIKLPEGVK